jgi:hypothetical protein
MDAKPVGDAKAPKMETGWFGGFSYAINKKSVIRSKSKNVRFEYRTHQRLTVPMNKTGGFVSIQPKNEKHKAAMFLKVEFDKFFGSAEFTIAPTNRKTPCYGHLKC